MGFLNLLWFVFMGWWSAVLWLLLSGLFAITVVGLPIAKACFQFAKLSAFPFGKEVIKETELKGSNNVSGIRKVGGVIVNIIWFPIGIVASIICLAEALVGFITIFNIPVGIVKVRMAKFILFPIGAKVVTKKQAYASAAANEIERRK